MRQPCQNRTAHPGGRMTGHRSGLCHPCRRSARAEKTRPLAPQARGPGILRRLLGVA